MKKALDFFATWATVMTVVYLCFSVFQGGFDFGEWTEGGRQGLSFIGLAWMGLLIFVAGDVK